MHYVYHEIEGLSGGKERYVVFTGVFFTETKRR